MSSPQYQVRHHDQQITIPYKIAKTTTAVTLGGAFLVLSGLTLAATVIGLAMATPLLVIFSPVIVPAVITSFLIISGFVVSGVCGLAASFVFYWMYRFAGGNRRIGVEENVANATNEMKERAAARLWSGTGDYRDNDFNRDIAVE